MMASAECEEGEQERSLWLYRKLPSDVREDDTLVQPTNKPDKFVSNFIKRHTPSNRKKELDKILSHKDMLMDTRGKKKKKKQENKGGGGRSGDIPQGRGKKRLSYREKKKLKLFDIPEEQQKYELFLPLHQLWLDYMRETLLPANPGLNNKTLLYARLLKCELHGCVLTVTKSKCPFYVGTSGILLQETKNTFKIITKENKLKTIPKNQCWFMFTVDQWAFTIYGQHFCQRTSIRSTKKFKSKPTIDL